jgi:zinc transport system substrate-binding protein
VAQASFFVFGDFARQVAGETARAETLVPVGQHGHGWEPGPQVRQAVAEADLFVYGMEGFQPWADDMVRDVRAGDGGARTVAVGGEIDLIGIDHEEAHTDHHEETEHADHESGHDHGGADPHFWLDPRRASAAVERVREAFATVDPDDASRYADNASAYRERLAALDESFESRLAGATRDVVLVAGHDAFGYLGARYDIEFVTLTGLSPDGSPTPRDIERAQRRIDEHDLRYVCADPLASQRAARELVAETDAEETLPLTAIPGRNQAWADDGWGYVDVMESVNLPTLARALGAE